MRVYAQNFPSCLQFSKVGKIMRQPKYGHLIVPVVFSGKVILDIDFTDELVVQGHVPVHIQPI